MEGPKMFNQGGSMENDIVSRGVSPEKYNASVEALKKFAEKRVASSAQSTPEKGVEPAIQKVKSTLPYLPDRDDDELVRGPDGEWIKKSELL